MSGWLLVYGVCGGINLREQSLFWLLTINNHHEKEEFMSHSTSVAVYYTIWAAIKLNGEENDI